MGLFKKKEKEPEVFYDSKISFDSGLTFCTAEEAMPIIEKLNLWDKIYAEPWPEREEELRGLYDQLLDEKYAIVRKGYLRGKYKEIFTKDFVLNSRNRLITMWGFRSDGLSG